MATRREFLKYTGLAGLGLVLTKNGLVAMAPAAVGLSDPALQPKFEAIAPNALSPGFIYQPDRRGRYKVQVRQAMTQTGLRAGGTGALLSTPIFGYADQKDRVTTWPGRTFEVRSTSFGGPPETEVIWANALNGANHLVPVDTSLHWCYSLPGYQGYTIPTDGVPIITHLHGGHSDFQFDGNPEFFYGPDGVIVGPQWANVPGGFTTKFRYDNGVPAGNLWYHDHALGITRLNVYAGLAGFYFVRDEFDQGGFFDPTALGSDLGLPKSPYELAYAIQDRMFLETGELFYPAFPGDPAWDDFITGEGLANEDVPQPSALAEFFGDHMVVNGKIWPKTDVEPRHYRMRLLNGTDSRFLVLQFRAVGKTDTDLSNASSPIPFHVIGSDQGLAGSVMETDTLVFEPGGRYDIVFDFSDGLWDKRVIMANVGGDAPFGGEFGGSPDDFDDFFEDRQTDRIMAFDVVLPKNLSVPDDYDETRINGSGHPVIPAPTPTETPRRVALFEGKDEYGRLQPLLGTVAEDLSSATAYSWFQPTTENPDLGATETWEVYNFTGDAHPIHLHLVHFEIQGRWKIDFDEEEGAAEVPQHNGTTGSVAAISNIVVGASVTLTPADGYAENAPKDMVTVLPGQMAKIRATFDKPGRYVWHCHILSHEDHEMMRVLHVGPMNQGGNGGNPGQGNGPKK